MRFTHFLAALFLIVMIFISINTCQTNAPSIHSDSELTGKDVDVMFATFRSMNQKGVIEYYITNDPKRKFHYLSTDENTIFIDEDAWKPKGWKIYPEGCFMVLYCTTHSMAYYIMRIPCVENQISQ